jgi:hypothetical protein
LPPSNTIKRKPLKEREIPGTEKPWGDEGECPIGHRWGIDHNEHDECQDDSKCDQKSYESCQEECSRIKTEQMKKEKEATKPRSRKRNS